jgi:GAF domain-containing protein
LQALTRAAVEATAAAEGWLMAVDGDELRVVAAYGNGTAPALGMTLPLGQGSAGFVAASGQPLAITRHGDDPRFNEGVAGLLGLEPLTVLCVPCGNDDDIVGALELLDKRVGPFSFDDVEIATLLAGIAGVAVGAAEPLSPSPPSPEELSGELRRLAGLDPPRYAVMANVVQVLLARG